MRTHFSILAFSLVILLSAESALAHPGGTASDGCHYCRTHCSSWGEVAGQRHCHGGGSTTDSKFNIEYNDDDDSLHYQMLNQDTHSNGWCRSRYGKGALGGIHECHCKGGYMWNDGKTKCVSDGTPIQMSDADRLQQRLQRRTTTSVTNEEERIAVESVVDGDTIKIVLNGQRESIRIIGIDTPETVHPNKPVQCFGREASAKMKELVGGKVVELQKNHAEDRDKYERLLRYVHLNGQDIGAQMIRDGYAFSYKSFPHPRLEEYNRLEREAREANKGLWSGCDDVTKSAAPENDNGEFVDIKDTHPYLQAIRWGKTSRVLNGYPDGTFQPDKTVNRAEFLKIVLEGKGVNVATATAPTKFTDVDENAWYAPYVRYAKAQGIIQGYGDGSFKPSQPVNFAEALKMAYVALNVPSVETGGEWYERFLRHAKKNTVLFSDNVNVEAGMSRKDVVWIIYKMMNHTGQWQQPEAAAPKDKYDHAITRIELNGFPTSWDADAEDDGLELGANFYFKSKSNSDEPEQLGYPLNKDWTADVSIYDQVTDDDTFQDKKGQLLFHHKYTQSEVKYGADGNLYIQVPIEQMKDAGKTYAWVEATFSSIRGTFSSQSKYMTVRLETDTSQAAENQLKDLDLRSISGYAFWKNWDGDLEKDGFELQTYFKDVNDEQVYPNSKDWMVTVKIYNSENNYSKYKNFSTHKTTLANTATYSGNKVRYESLGSPFVRVSDEDLRGLQTERMIVEATYSSPTYGTFSMAVETPDDRNK